MRKVNNMDLKELEKIAKERLSEKRFYHSQCVMERCEEIAKKFGCDIETAKKVGIIHDIAKEIPPEEKLNYCKKYNIEVDEIEKENTSLLHAKIGADIAERKFGFTKQMANAIKAHTTGLPGMDMLAKILFIADRTSKERELSDIGYINELLDKNIDETILYILDKKIELQIQKRASMHINSIITRNWIIGELI